MGLTHIEKSKAEPPLLRVGRRFSHGLGRLISLVCSCLLYAYAVATLCGLVFILLDRTNVAAVELLKTALIFGLWPAPLLLLVILIWRRWRLAMLIVPAALAWSIYYPPYLLPKSISVPDDAPRLTVMTFNYLPRNNPQPLLDAILEADSDIVAIQQLNSATAGYLTDALADIYPYHALHPQESYRTIQGMGVFSRYPIEEDHYWRYLDLPETHGHQRLVIRFQSKRIVVYNTHPWPPINRNGRLQHTIAPDYDRSHRVAVERLIRRANEETLPVILMGDFNLTDQFEDYDLITTNFVDSFREAGQGMGYTYPGNSPLPPVIRLDYVFHSRHFVSIDARTGPNTGVSDHLPLRVTLALMDSN